ncbi:hypothetical protein ACSTHC_00095, partial [Vibrio parahaemolyticus]
ALTPKARARFAETARLLDAIKTAEGARATVWDSVKAANRELEAARADVNALQATVTAAVREAQKLARAKSTMESA